MFYAAAVREHKVMFQIELRSFKKKVNRAIATIALPQGFDHLPTQRVPPLVLFKKSIFGRPTLKCF